ncbi:hypothetical protein, partial [Streptococcus infantis]|uniref:hypothetical protein n=1 Tax=Streptococcus infantis TaxID=68892 RepID=UPI0039C49211
TPLLYRVWSFFGITFDAHPHSGWFICLAPNGARRTESHITKKPPNLVASLGDYDEKSFKDSIK